VAYPTSTLGDSFVAFLAVAGPPKVLLTFTQLAPTRTPKELARLALVATGAAAVVGVVLDYCSPAVLALFHIGVGAVELAGGLIFFLYALSLVLGFRLTPGEPHESASLVDGLRDLMVPLIAGPLVLAAVLLYAIENPGWNWRTGVAGTFLAVLAIDLACVLVLVGVLRRMHRTVVDVVARLLGLLLAALSIQVLLDALVDLGVPIKNP
jgi:multiple antibiotic resistance protein